ncbi:hypothetical protein [Halobaculum sp. D14]|uniref:hypothetical protein n=1 Tax=Halobaculum sp. D14 TaxID=3421642 RepID=UPI003EBC7EB7
MSSEEPPGGEDIGWGFPSLSKRGAGQGGDLTQFTMEGDLETFVREVLQNANDAGLEDSDEPVDVTFEIKELADDDLRRFKRAFRWDDWYEQVAAAAENNQIGRRIQQFADGVEEEGSLRLLTVRDENTQGLTGPDAAEPGRGSTNFSALVRDSLESNKDEESAGGKFGLGKAVLRIFSGTSTILFNSVLSEPDPVPYNPRVIGRTRLPQYWKDQTRHNGQGFFGDTSQQDDEHAPAASVWSSDAEELAGALQIDREDYDKPGTSISVVGFRDPVREEPRGVDELAAEIREEAVKWFWPAIVRDELRVSVKTEAETYEGTVDAVPSVRPFVNSLTSSPDEQLEEEGDVVYGYETIDVPDMVDDENVSPPTIEGEAVTSMPSEGAVGLAVRLTEDGDGEFDNSVALVRGSGMVVRYWDRDKLVHGSRGFHAVALGGKARAWLESDETTTDDHLMERFLKDAEPPTHDRWEQTSATRDDYKQGTKRAIDGLHDQISETVGSVVGPNVDRGTLGPELLANRFPITNQGRKTEPETDPRIEGKTHVTYNSEERKWKFEGQVSPLKSEYELTEVTISLRRMGEERQTNDYISIHNFSELSEGCTMTTGEDGYEKRFNVPDDVRTFEFIGWSDPDYRKTKMRLNVDAKVVKKEGGES